MTCNFIESGDFNTQLSQIENSQMAMDLFGIPNYKLSNGNNLRFNKKGSISVDLATGRYYDFAEDSGGYLVNEFKRKNDIRTTHELIEALGLISQKSIKVKAKNSDFYKELSPYEKTIWAWNVWNSGTDLHGTAAYQYLTTCRCIPENVVNNTSSLRFGYTRKPYFEWGDKYPALLAAITDINGIFKGVHITFIDSNGMGKLFEENSKYIAGSGIRGCSIILGASLDNVILAEGIESALSVASIVELTPIATISSGGMGNFLPPIGVKSITYAPDIDESGVGYKSAQKSATNQFAQGIEIKGFLCPPHGFNDWNDALIAKTNGGFHNA